MNRLMKCIAATAVMGIALGLGASSVHADHEPGDPDEHGPYVEVLPPLPPVTPPVLTVPVVTQLPITGTDSFDLVTIGSIAGVTGVGLLVVARTRRRSPATTV